MTQAKQTDFAKFALLSEAEQKVIEEALAALPDDILSTGERAPIESRIRRRLEREGLLETEAPMGMGAIPPVAYVGRAVGCLAANYLPLRCILHNKPASEIAESIAKIVAECVRSGTEAIKTDIMACREQVASALGAFGLTALGDALLGDDENITRY
ncbi:MAG TPA: hypothetical protein VFO16_09370 [Pseudonocardiaceae bacterium]|nr:hypothetical protein [Pseudonocardiaceae bacterium]